jgi:hypothetical protein
MQEKANKPGGEFVAKSLEDMTNDELFRLFPIIISENDPIWRKNYLVEKSVIEKNIGIDNIVILRLQKWR